MARFLIAAIAAVTAALGLVMDNIWLLGAAAAFFLLALITLVFLASRRRLRRAEQERLRARTREDELRDLGISEVRPRSTTGTTEAPLATAEERRYESAVIDVEDEALFAVDAEESYEPEVDEAEDFEEVAGGAAATPEAGPLPERAPNSTRDDQHMMLPAHDDHRLWQTHSPTAFASFLRACWAATEAQTALLASEEHDRTFELLAIRSHVANHRTEGRFAADSFLHVAHPDRPFTALENNDPLVKDLPYYRGSVLSGGVAILPIQTSSEMLYLVVDLPPDRTSFTERQRVLLQGFADLLRTIVEYPPEEVPTRSVPTRRSIISEEMARARAKDKQLSLALVYRTDAESVSGRGEAGVAEAERDMRLLLEDLVHHGRLERFGELMYGAFLHDTESTLESWAERVQRRASEEGFAVGIGVARMQGHADADALRADAANALAEALQSPELVAFARTPAE